STTWTTVRSAQWLASTRSTASSATEDARIASSTVRVAQRVASPAAARASRSARRPRSSVNEATPVTVFSPGGRIVVRTRPPARGEGRRPGGGSVGGLAPAVGDQPVDHEQVGGEQR